MSACAYEPVRLGSDDDASRQASSDSLCGCSAKQLGIALIVACSLLVLCAGALVHQSTELRQCERRLHHDDTAAILQSLESVHDSLRSSTNKTLRSLSALATRKEDSAKQPALDPHSPNLCGSNWTGDVHPSYPVPVPSTLRPYCIAPYPMTPMHQSTLRAEDLAIGLLTVDRYKFTRDEYSMQTWLTPLQAPRAYFTCTVPRDPALRQPCLRIPHSNDLYLSNVNKTLIGLRELYLRHPDSKWFWLSSDDAYINVDYTLNKLEHLDPERDYYVGHAIKGPVCADTQRAISYVTGGAGMLVSRALMRRAAPLIEPYLLRVWFNSTDAALMVSSQRFGDVCAGCFFASLGVSLTELPGFHIGHPTYPNDAYGWRSAFMDHRTAGAEVNNWHYVSGIGFLHADLFYTLQRIDRWQRHGHMAEMANYARTMAAERFHAQQRNMELLAFWRKTAGETDK